VFTSIQQDINGELDEIRSAGLFKAERVIVSPQGSSIRVGDGREVLNLCANNYLGLADDPRIVAAAKEALDRWGYGLASVRFICGTQGVHKQLEQRISGFLGTEDTILYSPASTLTGACSRHCSASRTPSSATN
jgi:glycine C-acetyltransferase